MDKPAQPSIAIYGTSACGDCIRSKRWLEERGFAYSWYDISQDSILAERVQHFNRQLGIARLMQIPVIQIEGHPGLSEPTDSELAAALEYATER